MIDDPFKPSSSPNLSKLLSDADLSRAIAQISNPLFDQSVYKKATQMANALEDSAIGQAIKQIKNMEGSANMHTVKMAKLMEESAAGQAIKLWKNMEENAYGHAVKMANLVENSAVERAIKQIKDMEGTAYGQAIEIASLMEGSAINKALKQWSATFDPIAKIREDTLKLWDSQFSVAEVIKKWSAPSSIQGALKSTVLDEVFSRLDTHDLADWWRESAKKYQVVLQTDGCQPLQRPLLRQLARTTFSSWPKRSVRLLSTTSMLSHPPRTDWTRFTSSICRYCCSFLASYADHCGRIFIIRWFTTNRPPSRRNSRWAPPSTDML